MLKEGVDRRRGHRDRLLEREDYLDKLFAGSVAPLLMGPVCLISQRRFEKPVRRYVRLRQISDQSNIYWLDVAADF